MTVNLDEVSGVKNVWSTEPVTDDKVNFVPDEAIEASEKARKVTGRSGARPTTEKAISEKKSDPYNEDRVSPNVPSKEQVKGTPPDRTVNPG